MNTYFEWAESNPEGLDGYWQLILAFHVPDDALRCKPVSADPLRTAKIHDGKNGKTAVCSFIVLEECATDLPALISYMKIKAKQAVENAGFVCEPQQSVIEDAVNDFVEKLKIKRES